MKRVNTFIKFSVVAAVIALLVLIVIKPDICKNGAVSGILLCGRVLIPSLFPFSVCVLFLMKSGMTVYAKKLSPVTTRLLGLSGDMFCIVLLSFLGGYPIGAKLLNEAAKNKKISSKAAGRILNFSVNAGPAFVVAAVGNGIMGSKKLGYILLISHIAASFIIMLLARPHPEKDKAEISNKPYPNTADCFVLSVSDGSAVTLSLCAFVILFSVISAYTEYFSAYFNALVYLSNILEVTTAVAKTGNIYFISFLLGFAGISVWCQIMSAGRYIKINFLSFAFFRILHGIISSFLTAVIIKASGIAVPCITNSVKFSFDVFYSTPALSVSLLIMGILFLISVFSKKQAGKLLEDVV